MKIVIPLHSEERGERASLLIERLAELEPDADVVVLLEGDRLVGQRRNEVVRASNHPVVGFLEPEVEVRRSFSGRVEAAFRDPLVLVAHTPGCLFVRRDWVVDAGGFAEDLFMGLEQRDLILRAGEVPRRKVVKLDVPITYDRPEWGPAEQHKSVVSERRFAQRWSDQVTNV